MTQQMLDLLPYEFARVNRVLLRADEGDLLLGSKAPDWAIAEVSRMIGRNLKVQTVADADFDAALSTTYSGRQHSSEAVMADMKDLSLIHI